MPWCCNRTAPAACLAVVRGEATLQRILGSVFDRICPNCCVAVVAAVYIGTALCSVVLRQLVFVRRPSHGHAAASHPPLWHADDYAAPFDSCLHCIMDVWCSGNFMHWLRGSACSLVMEHTPEACR
jgi:hypothetical protein